ncbi:MAG: LysR family transcriptional regulator [Alphaproteobacteria bacterium]|nr:LysR family transcriptional regulator [Alphaproteobacteria bacterium]
MDWDKLRVFHAVAGAGSFTHAGESLGLSQSAVSRQIGALEDSIGVALFHRHARGLLLTEQGELLFRTVHDVFSKLALVESRIAQSKDKPDGPLTVTTTIAFGTLWLTPRLREFIELFPDIALSLRLNDGELDLSMREADVAIRFTPPRQPDLIQRHLTTMNYRVYASAEYLKRRGIPVTAADLEDHSIIVYGDDAHLHIQNMNWLLSVGREAGQHRTPILKVNNIYGIYRAVQSGIGIAALPDYFSREVSNLVHILPELQGPTVGAYFVYPEELRNSKRVIVFRDFLLRQLEAIGSGQPD